MDHKNGGEFVSGGSSGGGSVNIFAMDIQRKGSIVANGGEAQLTSTVNWGHQGCGGKGGDGTTTIGLLSKNGTFIEDVEEQS